MKNLAKNLFRLLLIIIIFGLSPLIFPIIVIYYSRQNLGGENRDNANNKNTNFFKFLDEYFDNFKKLIKNSTKLDFFDWCNLSLFISGLFAIWFFYRVYYNDISIGDLITAIVLWFTAIAIMQYTKETHWLTQVQIKQLKQQRAKDDLGAMPFLRIQWGSFENDNFLILANDGKMIAKNIQLKIVCKKDKQYSIKTVPVVRGNGAVGIDLEHAKNARGIGGLNENVLNNWKTWKDSTEGVNMIIEAEYEDIYDRPYAVKFQFDKSTKDDFKIISQKPDGWKIGEGFKID